MGAGGLPGEAEAVARAIQDELPYAIKDSTAVRVAERAIRALRRVDALASGVEGDAGAAGKERS